MKKRKSFYIIVIIILSIFVYKCSLVNIKKDTNKELEQEINEILNSLTLEEKIGQMLIIDYRLPTMDETLKSDLLDYKPGGFILFNSNFTSYTDTLKFINDIKSTADIPMFISVDQEGGRVQRLNDLSDGQVTKIPDMQTLGKTNDANLAKEVGKVIAEELQVFGINMNFAPVIDVLSNDNNQVISARSFGNDPKMVSKMGISLASGLKDNGVIPVYKHFPGHGNTEVDSHYDLPIITKTKKELLESDLIPFKEAIDAKASVIMVGHLAIPLITGDNTPSSLSKILITDILKKELSFNGLIITDALNMQALTKNYTEKEIYEMAINAGVDLLLMPKSASSAIKLIKESINEGTINESQINASVKKILKLKLTSLSNKTLPKDYLGSASHQEVINKILNYSL